MRRIFQIMGILVLVVGSFIYTDEVSMTAKNTDELLNYSSDSNGYINEITLLLDAKSNKSLKFYRLNNDTYSINTFSIMEVDCWQ